MTALVGMEVSVLTNTIRYLTMERHDDGDLTNGDGHEALATWEVLLDALAGLEDDGRTVEIVRVSYDEHGVPTAEVDTEAVAHGLARRAEILEGEDGLDRHERPTLHPLVEAHTDFRWKPDAEEREDEAADAWREAQV